MFYNLTKRPVSELIGITGVSYMKELHGAAGVIGYTHPLLTAK